MKPFSAACEQNKEPILEVLKQEFKTCNSILEIGSGTGQHAAYFRSALDCPGWQASDRAENLPGICAWTDADQNTDALPPIVLDVEHGPWPEDKFDGVFSANTCHIMHWPLVQYMFQGIDSVLHSAGVFCLYGPFNYDGNYTSPSNQRFDAWLKQQDPLQGIRDFEALNHLAVSFRWQLSCDYSMPANNRILVWRKPS